MLAGQQLGQFEAGGSRPGGIPAGLAEGLLGLLESSETTQAETEQVERLGVRRVGIAPGQPDERSLDPLQCAGVVAGAVDVVGQREIGADIARIPGQRLVPVGQRGTRGVPVLGEMEARQVQLLDRLDLLRGRRLLGHPGLGILRAGRSPADQQASLGVAKFDSQPGRVGGRRSQHGRDTRGQILGGLGEDARIGEDAQLCAGLGRGHRETRLDHAVVVDVDGGVRCRLVYRADARDRVPILAEGLGLARQQPGEVGLVVGVDAGHQLDVGTVRIRELRVPGMAERRVPPGPQLLPRRQPAFGPMNHAGSGSVVVATEEVLLGVDDHVGGRDGHVAVPVDPVRAGVLRCQRGVVDAVVAAIRGRVGRQRAAGVVGDVSDVLGEEGLVVVVDSCRDIRPPQEGLPFGGAIVQPGDQFDDRRLGPEPDSVLGRHPGEGVMVGAPDRHRPVGAVVDRGLDRQPGGRPVVLGPVELHPAADPRTSQADQGRFDDVVAVEEVVAGDLVVAHVDPPAQLGQDHQPEVAVLQMDRLPLPGGRCIGDAVDEGDRVDLAAGSLVHPVIQEHRVRAGVAGRVGADRHRLLPRHGPAVGQTILQPGGSSG